MGLGEKVVVLEKTMRMDCRHLQTSFSCDRHEAADVVDGQSTADTGVR